MEFLSYDIVGNDYRQAGKASRAIKEHLKRIGADAEAIRRTMIAAYEAEMNAVIHADGGRLEASLTDTAIDVNVIDEGPGIPDIELAMKEGFSTACAEARALGFGAGMGLPNIVRNSDRVRVSSRVNEGTRVSFTVYLKPEATCGPCPTSLYASVDRCQDCRRCITACPTQAMRVRGGRPGVLEHLCVDCTCCIAACAPGALTVRDDVSSLEGLTDIGDLTLAVPPALLAGCGPDYQPAQVLAALRSLGFGDVVTVAPYERALREAVLKEVTADGGRVADEQARGNVGEAAGPGTMAAGTMVAGAGAANGNAAGPVAAAGPVTAAAPVTAVRPINAALPGNAAGPVIIPMCPAVVNLIELRFPSLVPQVAPFDSPWEALQAEHADRPMAYVVSCPSQRSALVRHEIPAASGNKAGKVGKGTGDLQGEAGQLPACAPGHNDYLTPELLRQAAMRQLAHGDVSDRALPCVTAPDSGAQPIDRSAGGPGALGARTNAADDRLLTVTGIDHVIAVLEQLEDGLLDDVSVIEPWACEGGCFGSPLLSEDHHLAERRWSRGAMEIGGGAAVARRTPYEARPGVRLDSDMGRAIEKLGRLQAIIQALPGKNCGACGAPTCAAFADDVVMERAGRDLCPYAENDIKEPER